MALLEVVHSRVFLQFDSYFIILHVLFQALSRQGTDSDGNTGGGPVKNILTI